MKRDAFVDAAQRLILSRGYEEMSVQDVLDEVQASRGAFYHYFDSKEALLEAVVERLADGALATLGPVVGDPGLGASRKLELIFSGIANFKEQRKELVLRIVEVWSSNANAIVRERVRELTLERLVPMLAEVVEQGAAEGDFAPGSGGQSALVLVSLMLSFQQRAVELFLARQAGTVGFEEVRQVVDAWTRAYERVLGAAEGSLTLTDERTLRFWFG